MLSYETIRISIICQIILYAIVSIDAYTKPSTIVFKLKHLIIIYFMLEFNSIMDKNIKDTFYEKFSVLLLLKKRR